MHARTAARLAISVVAFCVAAELFALIWYFMERGGLFYVEPRPNQELLRTTAEKRPAISVHPYFGYAHRPNATFSDERLELLERDRWRPSGSGGLPTNNFGFISPYAYPFAKTHENEFVVGIFGGSVGMWFCQVGAPYLIERLREHSFFRIKQITPLCLGYSGYKQPQLALVLAYFLSVGQTFDLVVNIDGFNDVALAAINDARGLDISMPSVQHVEGLVNLVNQSTLTPQKLESLVGIFRYQERLRNLNTTIRDNRSAAVDFALNSYSRWVHRRYTQQLARFAELPSISVENTLIQLTRPIAARTQERRFADIADLWARSSILMNDMLSAGGAAYVHFLQPNQYYTTRTFSAAEAATALTDQSPYKQNVERGYPLPQAAARSVLRANGVAFFDATGVLDREPSPVYLDDCCHYTVAGNRVLADFVATSVINTPGPWRD